MVEKKFTTFCLEICHLCCDRLYEFLTNPFSW